MILINYLKKERVDGDWNRFNTHVTGSEGRVLFILRDGTDTANYSISSL